MFGFALGMYTCTIWPTVSQYVGKKYSSIAFGIGISIQNMGIGIGPFLISFLRQNTLNYKKGYFWVNILCSFEALIGLLCCVLALKFTTKKIPLLNPIDDSESKYEMISYHKNIENK